MVLWRFEDCFSNNEENMKEHSVLMKQKILYGERRVYSRCSNHVQWSQNLSVRSCWKEALVFRRQRKRRWRREQITGYCSSPEFNCPWKAQRKRLEHLGHLKYQEDMEVCWEMRSPCVAQRGREEAGIEQYLSESVSSSWLKIVLRNLAVFIGEDGSWWVSSVRD